MGQKVNPTGFRLGSGFTWSSRWFAHNARYREALKEDVMIRKYLKKRLKDSSVAKVDIERSAQNITVQIYTAKPGLVIGRGGQGATELQNELKRLLLDLKRNIQLTITEVDHPNLSAMLAVQAIAADIEKRIPFRRAMKQAMSRISKAGAGGVKVQIAGRLDGSEIARTEKLAEGKIPLHTIRAHIDYGRGVARTTYGIIGIKVWVYRGDFPPGHEATAPTAQASNEERRPASRRGRRPTNQSGPNSNS